MLLDTAVFCGLVGVAVATRLVMIEPNFHAVTAAALFAGFYFRHGAVAVLVPLVAMTASDWIIGGYTREVMLTVYAALVLPVFCRSWLRHRLGAGRVTFSAIGCSLAFFLATNAAVWHSGIWHSRGWDGLVACYAAGLPFLRNAVTGDLVFSAAFFGAYVLATRFVAASRPALIVKAAGAST